MADKIIPIDSKYRNKHYSNGFFAAVTKNARSGEIAIIICGLIIALIGAAILGILISVIIDGGFNPANIDMGETILMSIIGLMFFAPGIFCIWFGFHRRKTNEDDWIMKFMEASDYPESVIRDFGNQVLEEGSFRMQLGSPAPGFLTRDYICIANLLAPCVIKIEDIVGTYFVQISDTINVNGKTYSKNIAIFSNHKTMVMSAIKEKGYRQIVEILKQKNPSIDTANGRMLSEKEYNQIFDQLSK